MRKKSIFLDQLHHYFRLFLHHSNQQLLGSALNLKCHLLILVGSEGDYQFLDYDNPGDIKGSKTPEEIINQSSFMNYSPWFWWLKPIWSLVKSPICRWTSSISRGSSIISSYDPISMMLKTPHTWWLTGALNTSSNLHHIFINYG